MNLGNTVSCPEHYSQVARELTRLNKTIIQGVLHRPYPKGREWVVPNEISRLFEKMLDLIGTLSREIEAFSKTILATDTQPTDADVGRAFERVSCPVERLLELYHVLWQRPFPEDLAPGQYLLSEIMERPLRGLFELFEKALGVIDNPGRVLGCKGPETISLSLKLDADREVCAFLRWCDDFSLAEWARDKGGRRKNARASRVKLRHPGRWFGVAVACLFGWFMGKKSHES